MNERFKWKVGCTHTQKKKDGIETTRKMIHENHLPYTWKDARPKRVERVLDEDEETDIAWGVDKPGTSKARM